MSEERTFPCEFCGREVQTTDPRKRFCTKQHADMARSRRGYSSPLPPALDPSSVPDLSKFSKYSESDKEVILLGEAGHRIVSFDIEASHLKPNVGRTLCVSFKPLGEDVYTFGALDRRFKKRDVYDDGELAITTIRELEKYDIIIGWNSKGFDTKFLNARALRVGGRVKRAQYHVDGMWSWRSKVLAWSKLDTAHRYLEQVPASTHKTSVDWPEWMRVIGWDPRLRKAAMDEIIDHCERDVVVLEEVYRAVVKAGMVRSIRRDGGVL